MHMIRNCLVATLLLWLVNLGLAQELTIVEQDYELAKSEALKQHKMLLIDFYTTWCGPCKKIDEVIFGNPSIRREFSEHLVVLRYDAEKDAQHRLSLKHHVGQYPTTILLTEDQFVLNKLIGTGGNIENLEEIYRRFIQEGLQNKEEKKWIRGVSNRIDLVYPKFYEEFVFRINTKPVDQELKAYWETNEDFLSETSFTILSYFGGTGAVDSFFLENIQKYEELFGKQDVGFVKGNLVFLRFMKAIKAKDRAGFDAAATLTKKVFEPLTSKEIIVSMEQRMIEAEKPSQSHKSAVLMRPQSACPIVEHTARGLSGVRIRPTGCREASIERICPFYVASTVSQSFNPHCRRDRCAWNWLRNSCHGKGDSVASQAGPIGRCGLRDANPCWVVVQSWTK